MPENQASGRNSEVLADFVKYCEAHPDERFWQALRNWSGYAFIMASLDGYRVLMPGSSDIRDTFHWEGKRHDDTK
jgi:hypothetical protein